MQAVIQTGGKQYVVKEGQKLKIEKLTEADGGEVSFPVMAIAGETVKIGTPTVDGAKVTAKVLRTARGPKIIVHKHKRRKGYHKTTGHRQSFTEVEITKISV
jgi:large subunit ribosomal protein L21